MPKIRQVPGVGRVRFPDSMSDEDIDAAVENRVWEKRPPVQSSLNILPPPQFSLQPPIGQPTMGLEYPLAPVSLGGEPPNIVDDDPFAPAGKALTLAGKATVAALPELWKNIREQMNPMGLPTPTGPVMTGEMEERQLERDLPGYIRPPSNLEAVGMGEPMPAEYQSKFLPPFQRGMLRGSQGFIESTPRLAAMSAMTGGAGIPTWMAGGLSFGATEEGLDPKATAIGAALPVAGHGLTELSKLAAVRMGITQPEALNWIKGIVGTVGPAGGLYGEQLHTINQMEAEGLIDKQDADDQRMTALFSMGYNLGQGPMGVKWESTRRPPIIPQRRTQNMLRELPGAEHLNELERAWVDAEREAIDTPMRVVKEPEPDSDDPFARSKKREKTGVPMRMNKDTGEIEIYPGELSDYLSTVSENRRGAAMRGRFDEEEIHDNTEPLDAAEFYQGSSPLSRSIFNRVYIGNGEGRDPVTGQKLTDAELGYEMVRIRMQQLGRDGPVEIAEAALRERWTLRSLLALDAIVRKAEEATMAGSKRNAARQREILQNVKDNLAVAKRAIETSQAPPRPTRVSPAARRKQRLPYDERTRQYFAMMRQATDDPEVAKQAEQEIAQRDRESEPPTPIGEATVRETFRTRPGQQEMDLGPTERTTDASQDPQAAEVYGDLRAQSRAGEAQVPTQEGGAQVQPPGVLGPAARMKRRKAAQIALELNHGGINSDGIEAKVAGITGASVDEVNRIKNFLLQRGSDHGMRLLSESFIRRGWSDSELDLSPGARRKFNLEAKTEKEIVNELGRGLIDLLMSGLVGDKQGISDTVEGLGEFVKVLKGKIESGAFKDLDLYKVNSAIRDVESAISQFPMLPVGKEPGATPKFDTKLMEPTETIQATEDRVKHILGLVGELWNMGNHTESIEMSQALKKFIDDSANRFQDKIELEAGHSPDTVRRTQAFIDHLRMVSGRVERQMEADVRDQQTAFPAARRKKNLPEVQSGLDFEGPTSMTPQANKGAVEGATAPKFAPISPDILEKSVGEHILENPDPSFNAFAKMASDRWGVQPGQLENVWKGKMWDTLMKATGRQLTELVFRLDLGGQLKLRKNLEKMAAARATESGEAVRQAPSISSGENLVIANKMYGQIPDAPAAADPIVKQFLMEFEGQPSEMMPGLRNALKRAETAKKREAEYNKWFDQAKDLREQLRNAGFTNIDDAGNPTGGGEPNIAAKGIGRRLRHARIKMDELADPDYFSRPEDRELVSKRKVRQNIYPTDPVTGEQTSIHPIGTKVYTKLVSRGKTKVPEYESMARPGFSPGLPPRKGSAQTRAAQERRLRVIAAIGERLLEQQQSKQEKLMRREVTPDDVAYYRGPEALRQLTPEEQRDVGTVSAIIGAAPAPDRATVTEKVIGGTKTAVRRERNTEAATRNLVALEDAQTGRVYLVSTYTGGDGIVRVLNPGLMHLQRKHEALSPRFLRQYKPLWSLQLDQPVRDFMQRFENKDQFRREFVSEAKARFGELEAERDVMKLATPDDVTSARERLAARMALGVTDPEQFKTLDEQLRQRQAELESPVSQKSGVYGEGRLVSDAVGNPNVTAQEAGAIWQALKLWQRKDPASVIAEFQRMQREAPKRSEFETQAEQQERSQSRLALIGLNKILKQAEAEGMGIAHVLNEMSRLGQRRGDFIRSVVSQYAKAEPPHEVGSARRPIGAAPEPSPTELTMLSKEELAQRNYLREQIGLRPLGPQRDPAIHVPETYRRPETKMMTPEEAEFVSRQRPSENPAARNKMVQAGMNAVRDVLVEPTGAFIRYYSGWMSQRLREGGGKVANSTADIFDQIIDREKQLMGSLTKYLDPALKEVGKPRLGTWLNGYDVIGGMAPDAAIGRSQGAIEGWLALPGSKLVGKGKNAQFTPSWADNGVHLARAANYAAGRMIASVTPGFQASGKFERHLTSVGYDIIRTGSGPLYEAWLNGMAEANTPHTHARNTKQGMKDFLKTRQEANDMFQRMKKILDEPAPDMIELDKVNQDFRRVFPRAVTHVRSPGRGIFGGWKEVLHSNMFNYLNATAKRASHMRSFREQFPNSVVGRSAFKKMREDIATEFDPNFQPGDKNLDAILGNFDALTRALQGHSTDQYGHNRNWMHEVGRPGTAVGDIARFANTTAMNLMAKLVLSKQLITQTGELAAGSTPQYLGYGNYARAARMMGGDALRKQSFFDLLGNPRKFLQDLTSAGQVYQQLEQQGMVNRVMYDWAFDPKTPITALTSGSKIVGNVISKVFMENLLNETQEAMAAATAKVTAERIASGNLSKWEQRHLPATFKAMGFQPGEVNALMQGDPGLLDMFQRRASAFLTGGNKHVAESSRIGANRLFNSVFRFQSYPMMKANQLRQDIINRMQSKTGGARAVANQKLARNLFFNTAQGAITAGVAAAVGGSTSLGIKASETKDQPFKSLLEFYFAANSGPLYLLWRNAGDAGVVGATEQVGRMMFPYSIANEFMDMANGVGAYRDQSVIEKVGTFARKKTPGLEAAKSGMSYFGLGQESADMNAARDAFYRWQRSEGIGGGRPGRPKNEEDKIFRLNMRRATAAIIAGDEQKFLNSAYEAVGVKNAEDAAASLRGRRLLEGMSLEEKSRLMNRIGFKAYNILEGHDAMLGAAAERLNPTD